MTFEEMVNHPILKKSKIKPLELSYAEEIMQELVKITK